MNPVILVHGIHTSKTEARAWMRDMGAYLKRVIPEIEVHEFRYGWTSGVSVRLPVWGWFSRRRKTKKFQRFVAELAKKGGNAGHADVVAHSFGTWLTHHSMTKGGPKTFFRRLVYMGGIVSSRENFEAEQTHHERLLNMFSRKDDVVRFAPFGHCGYRGFLNVGARVKNLDMTPLEHGEYLTSDKVWTKAADFLAAK